MILQVLDKQISELYALIKNNPTLTKQYIEEAIEPIEDTLEEIQEDVDDRKKYWC